MNSKLPEEAINPLPSASIEQQSYIQYQSLMLLVTSLNKAIYVFPLTASILTILFWPHTNQIILGSWLVTIYAFSLVRYAIHERIKQHNDTSLNYAKWLKCILILDVIGGTLVGSSSTFIDGLPQEFQWLLIIVVLAITMESVAAQSAIKSSFISFTLPLFSSFILGLLLTGNNIFYIVSAFALLHAIFIYGNFTAMHQHINTNLKLTFSNQQLAKQLNQKNQALVIANEQVNAASQAKSKFIISMNQELRLPLQGMLKLLKGIPKNHLTSEHSCSLSIIQSSGDGLLSLLSDLKDVYRLEKGMLTPKLKEFEVREHFESITHLLAINAHVKGLKLFCTIDSNVPAKIESDPIRLSQITLNLLTNALKFTNHGYVELKVSSQTRDEQTFLIIKVTDTGIGIKQDDMKMIFEPFIQGKSDAETLGNGLGLAISREICQLLHADMSAHSVSGEGSVFSFKVPIKIRQQGKLSVLHNKKIILLVEGDKQHEISIEQQLRFLNQPYETANNAKEAMATCAEKRNKFSTVIIGHQSELQQKLLINLCQRLKLQTIELFDFGKVEDSMPSALTYPVKLEQLNKAITSKL